MIIESTLDTKYFLDICSNLEYKDKDELEAQDIIGSKDGTVLRVLRNAPNRWAEHYIVRDEKIDKIVCTITLDINNNLHYFVTKDLQKNNSISFVKTIKKLVEETIKYKQVVYVTTKDWYSEAVKFNKLIGFKVLFTNKGKKTSTWYYSKSKGY